MCPPLLCIVLSSCLGSEIILKLESCVCGNQAKLQYSVRHEGNEEIKWNQTRPNTKMQKVVVESRIQFSSHHSCTKSQFLLFLFIFPVSISPRVHCSAGNYRCPPCAPVSHHVCLRWGMKRASWRDLSLWCFFHAASFTKSLTPSQQGGDGGVVVEPRSKCGGGGGGVALKDGWGGLCIAGGTNQWRRQEVRVSKRLKSLSMKRRRWQVEISSYL